MQLFDLDDPRQGIAHVVSPEQGIALPGCTLVCPDSHTCTVGGLGALAWGIGSTEGEHAVATQTLVRLRVCQMQVRYDGRLMFEQAAVHWRTLISDDDAAWDERLVLEVSDLAPQVTWGTSPEQAVAVDAAVPDPGAYADASRRTAHERALAYMDLQAGQPLQGLKIDAAFIGACTNSRLPDLREAAAVVPG